MELKRESKESPIGHFRHQYYAVLAGKSRCQIYHGKNGNFDDRFSSQFDIIISWLYGWLADSRLTSIEV